MYKHRKAVSPVIATVILVAVAITISVAVAYWMGGISSQYTKFEKVEVTSALVQTAGNTWVIDVNLKNTGTSTCTITDVYINDRAVGTALTGDGTAMSDLATGGLVIPSGAPDTIQITIQKGSGTGTGPFNALTAGTTVNLKFHSAGGMDYLKLVELV